MSYHDKIMNIPVSVTMSEIGLREHMLVYKDGHADALHAAAEIAVQADARIEMLLESLQEMTYWFGAYPEFVPKVEMVDNYKKAIARAQTAIVKAQTENNA